MQVYDNDAETLAADRQYLGELICEVEPTLRIIALLNNDDTVEAGGEAEHEDYFVLGRGAPAFEEQLRALLVTREVPPRFALVRRNHVFTVRHGAECSYETSEMTLAIRRLAFTSERCVTSRSRLLWKSALLALIAYAILHLCRLVNASGGGASGE